MLSVSYWKHVAVVSIGNRWRMEEFFISTPQQDSECKQAEQGEIKIKGEVIATLIYGLWFVDIHSTRWKLFRADVHSVSGQVTFGHFAARKLIQSKDINGWIFQAHHTEYEGAYIIITVMEWKKVEESDDNDRTGLLLVLYFSGLVLKRN